MSTNDVAPVTLDIDRFHELIDTYRNASHAGSIKAAGEARTCIINYFIAHDAALQARIAELEKDAARMDWVQKNLLSADFEYEYAPGKKRPALIIGWLANVSVGGNARKTIDAAIEAGK